MHPPGLSRIAGRLGAPRTRRLAYGLAIGVSGGFLVAAILVELMSPGMFAPDANTYRAAGERLNAGHLLYALLPGDRPIEANPPYWTVPLLSPPPIAVLWRPLVLLPGDLSIYAWWAAMTLAMAGALILLVRRAPLATSIATVLVALPLALAVKYANVNGVLLLIAILAWLAVRERRDAAAGLLVASMVALKLTPLPLALWLVVIGRYRAAAWAVTGLIALGAVSLLGAGIDAHLTYLDVARRTLEAGAGGINFVAIGRSLGVPASIAAAFPWAWWILCAAAMVWWRHSPGRAFWTAILAFVLGSPVVHTDTLILLLALVAPVAWPLPGATPAPGRLPAPGPAA